MGVITCSVLVKAGFDETVVAWWGGFFSRKICSRAADGRAGVARIHIRVSSPLTTHGQELIIICICGSLVELRVFMPYHCAAVRFGFLEPNPRGLLSYQQHRVLISNPSIVLIKISELTEGDMRSELQ